MRALHWRRIAGRVVGALLLGAMAAVTLSAYRGADLAVALQAAAWLCGGVR